MRHVIIGISVAVLSGLLLTPEAPQAFWPNDHQSESNRLNANRIIVKLKQGSEPLPAGPDSPGLTGRPGWDRLQRKYGLTGRRKLIDRGRPATLAGAMGRLYVLEVAPGADLEEVARVYAELDGVEYAQPDYEVEWLDTPDDPLYPHQWLLNNTGQGHYEVVRIEGDHNDTLALIYGTPDADIDAAEVYANPPDVTHTAVVAIVDTGVDWDHPDLVGQMWQNPGEIPDNGLDDDHNGYVDDVMGWDFLDYHGSTVGPDNDPTDTFGHGTHCAGIVAAATNNAVGIAGTTPVVKIMALNCDPTVSVDVLIRGVVYAAENGADVISMSWGTDSDSRALRDAMDFAAARGVILAASAGNGGHEAYLYPAALPQTICVSASDCFDHVTSWSTFNDMVDVCAPGMSILSLRAEGTDLYAANAEPGVHIIDSLYLLASGTSMSAPVVAAVAGYLRSVSPGISADTVRRIIRSTADDILDPYGTGDNLPGWDKYSGYGRVNLYQALAAAPGLRAVIDSPTESAIISGSVVVTGTANGGDFSGFMLQYGVGADPTVWTNITTSSAPVTGGTLATWDVSALEGLYTLRLTVGANESRVAVYVTDGPVAEIQLPAPYDTLAGMALIVGSALCPDYRYSILEYGIGSDSTAWAAFDTITNLAYGQPLTTWELTDLPPDEPSFLRLTVYSSSGPVAADTVPFYAYAMYAGDNGWTVLLDTLPTWAVNYGDFDGDGTNELVVGTATEVLFYDLDGNLKTTGMPEFPPDDYTSPIAVGDLDDDNIDDIVALGVNDSGTVYGRPSGAPAFQITMESRPYKINSYRVGPSCPIVYLKDIDHDGRDEIHYYPSNVHLPGETALGYHYIYRSDGSPWGDNFPLPLSYSHCFPADLDGDGRDEIYCCSDSSHYLVQFNLDGVPTDSVVFEWEGEKVGPANLQFAAVDVDNDNVRELVATGLWGRVGHQSPYFTYVFDAGLSPKPGWPQSVGFAAPASPSIYGPVFGDLDNDGSLEYAISIDPSEYTRLRVWNVDGTSFLGGADTLGAFYDPVNPGRLSPGTIADLDGDGYADCLFRIAASFFDQYPIERTMAVDREAQVLPKYPASTNLDLSESYDAVATIGDLNQDGYVDYVIPARHKLFFSNRVGCVYHPGQSDWPMWGQNRRHNFTMPLSDEIVIACGDINGDQDAPNIADLVYLVSYLFRDGPPPPQLDMANVDGSMESVSFINVADVTYLVAYLFISGPPPVC